MNELLKNLCIVAIIFSVVASFGFGAAAAAANDAKELMAFLPATLISTSILISAIICLILLVRRRDRVPDFLRGQIDTFLNCGGFTFGFTVQVQDHIAYLVAHFQNQYERACVGRIALRPARRSFRLQSGEQTVIDIDCDGGAYGTVRLPLAVPRDEQGKRQNYDVCASVAYPEGRGQRLRFRSGLVIHNESTFRSGPHPLTVPGLMVGVVLWKKPASLTLVMPTNVEEKPTCESAPEVTTVWKFGDPVPV